MRIEALFEQVEIDPESGCWLWNRGRDGGGYGWVSLFSRTRLAHRVAFEVRNGPIPDGLLVCHACDVPGCINPDHLWLGTRADNMRDMVRKGRNRNGHSKH